MNVVVVLLLAAAVALSKVVDSEAMVSNVKEGVADFLVSAYHSRFGVIPLGADASEQLIYALIGTDLCSDRGRRTRLLFMSGGASRWSHGESTRPMGLARTKSSSIFVTRDFFFAISWQNVAETKKKFSDV